MAGLDRLCGPSSDDPALRTVTKATANRDDALTREARGLCFGFSFKPAAWRRRAGERWVAKALQALGDPNFAAIHLTAGHFGFLRRVHDWRIPEQLNLSTQYQHTTSK